MSMEEEGPELLEDRDKVAVLTVYRTRYTKRLEVWLDEGMSGQEFAALLRQFADEFESGEAVRIT